MDPYRYYQQPNHYSDARGNEPPPNYLETGILIGIVMVIIIYLIYSWWYGLTDEEIAKCEDIMQNFHRDPNRGDFIIIWNLRQKLLRQTGRSVKFWIWGVYDTQPDFFDHVKKSEIALWARDIERGINLARTHPTSELLDCMWCLYFATGDDSYAEIVRSACTYHIEVIREAARQSYHDIIGSDWDQI